MTIAVTGANGFMGTHLTRALASAGHRVVAMVQPGTDPGPVHGVAAWVVQADVTDRAAVARAFQAAGEPVEAVCHLAAAVADWGGARLFREVNVLGTQGVLQAAAESGVRRFVLVSSLAVHAFRPVLGGDEGLAADASRPAYAVSKRAAEALVRGFHRAGLVEGVVVRPGLVPFGPLDRAFSLRMVRALKAGPVPLTGGGRARVSTAYVENLCGGLTLALAHPDAAGRTFVMGDDGAPRFADVVNAFAEAMGVRARIVPVPSAVARAAGTCVESAFRLLSPRREPPVTRYRGRLLAQDFHFASDLAKTTLGYSPGVDLAEAARRTVAWALAQTSSRYA